MCELGCSFKNQFGHKFECKNCKLVHECGDNCDSKFYNQDFTLVCRKSGLCFQQKVCDAYIDVSRGIANTNDINYVHRKKRDQQIKNSVINFSFVYKVYNEMLFFSKLGPKVKNQLISQVTNMWKLFIKISNDKKMYIHRKSKRCFIISILFHLEHGMSSNLGSIVNPHSHIQIPKLNKKKNYKLFNVSDVRSGTRLIQTTFLNSRIEKPIDVSSSF